MGFGSELIPTRYRFEQPTVFTHMIKWVNSEVYFGLPPMSIGLPCDSEVR